MKSVTIKIIASILVLFALALLNSLFVVYEGQQAIVVQLGRVVTSNPLKPGIHYKIPFIQDVMVFDQRMLDISVDSKEVIAKDQKRVIVDAFVKYKITNPLLFFQTAKSEKRLEVRLQPIVESNLREHIGKVTLACLINECRNQIMDDIGKSTAKLGNDFGIKVYDVKIRRTDLPDANKEAIFSRMQTEREKEAKEIRAKGREEASIIKSNADKNKEIIISDAEKKSSIIRGEGDAEVARIYNEAFNKDVDFFNFMRHMRLYKNAFNNKNTQMVLSGDESFLDFMQYKSNGAK